MELHQIKSFVTVAQTGNLTRAAERLNTTPPSVSAHIRQIEEQLDLKLFLRTPKGMELTGAGKALLQKAKEILDTTREFSRAADRLRGQVSGSLRLGLNADPGFLRIEPLVHLLFTRHPGLCLEVVPSNSPETLKQLISRELDLGFVFGDHDLPQGLVLTPLATVDLEIAVPKSFEADYKDAGWDQIAGLPWIRPVTPCPLLEEVGKTLARKHLTLTRPVRANDDIIKAAMIRRGIAATVLVRSEAQQLEKEGKIFIWNGHGGLATPLSLASLKARGQELELTAAAEAIREVWA